MTHSRRGRRYSSLVLLGAEKATTAACSEASSAKERMTEANLNKLFDDVGMPNRIL